MKYKSCSIIFAVVITFILEQNSWAQVVQTSRLDSLSTRVKREDKLSPGEMAEFNVHKAGGSQRQAYLASKEVSEEKLTTGEHAELKVLKTGGSQRQAYLASKEASSEKLSDQEKSELAAFSEGQFCSPDYKQESCTTPDGKVYILSNKENNLERNLRMKFPMPTGIESKKSMSTVPK